jgi:hypothetical protein
MGVLNMIDRVGVKVRFLQIIVLILLMVCFCPAIGRADDESSPPGRYGFLSLLDSRSQYGTDLFPEPLIAEEGDLEKEFSTSWNHTEGSGASSDLVGAELEWAFGLTTVGVESGWERDTAYDTDPITGITTQDTDQGVDSVEFGIRHPIYQWVSSDGMFDNTVVGGMSVAVPVHTPVSEDWEFEPQLWDMLRYGEKWTFQCRVADSILEGGGPDGNQHTFEYSATLGYTQDVSGLKFLDVRDVTPLAEIDGFDPTNKSDDGNDQLQGVLGWQTAFESSSDIQPKISVGFTLPIDAGAKRDFQWGCVVAFICDL